MIWSLWSYSTDKNSMGQQIRPIFESTQVGIYRSFNPFLEILTAILDFRCPHWPAGVLDLKFEFYDQNYVETPSLTNNYVTYPLIKYNTKQHKKKKKL